jgi:hypothetical protein
MYIYIYIDIYVNIYIHIRVRVVGQHDSVHGGFWKRGGHERNLWVVHSPCLVPGY